MGGVRKKGIKLGNEIFDVNMPKLEIGHLIRIGGSIS